MLSYQHTYHAGNFADVIKHLTLSHIINYLTQKDKPLFYLDTHTGRGIYDLKHTHAQKTKEYKTGIQQLWKANASEKSQFSTYINNILAVNENADLRHYPGSMAIAIQMLRSMDRLIGCDLHPTEYESLLKIKKQGKKVSFQKIDALEAMHALLPPPEKRGLIMIDPAYELKSEFHDVPQAIKRALIKFPTGTYVLWYPIIDNFHHVKLEKHMNDLKTDNMLHISYEQTPIDHHSMSGCGLFVVNPPYNLKDELKPRLDALIGILKGFRYEMVMKENP